MRYNNYHKHTHYSNIMTPDCVVKPIDYAKRAIELGHTSLVTTEHGYAGNVFEYYDLAQEYNLKFVFGVEFYFVQNRFEKDKSNTHIMALARNENGKKQLTKLISESNLTGFYFKPRVDMELLLSLNPEDVFLTSACGGSYINKFDDHEENFILPLLNHFKDNFMLEIQAHVHPFQIEYNKKILQLHKKYNIPMIHANDSHYIYPEQDKERTAFLNGKNIFYEDESGFIMDYPDSKTIFERYEKQGVFTKEQVEEALKNTLIIDEFDDIIMTKDIKMPKLHKNPTQKLKNIINDAWKKEREEIPKEKHKEYLERIRYEMDIVEKTDMAEYFVLNYSIIKRAKELGGVLTRTGRGSAPSFYMNKLLGFTEIDAVDSPIPLYPTRFMSISRILESKSLPDIDFNWADPEPAIQASKEILGEDNVYYMVAYGTMKDSAAFRNYCRSLDLKMDEYNEIAKDLDKYRNDEYWGKIIEESKKFLGVIDSVSPHPCAFLLLDKPISEEIGIIRTGSGNDITYCALIDSGTSDMWKYLKNDMLTVTVWRIISDTYKLLGKPIPNIRELNKLLDDNTWRLYEDGIVATLNQTGTDSGKPQVMRYKPKNIAELSAWVAAIRPSFKSMVDIFLDRKEFAYGIPEFDEILKPSHNFILYQENIMATLIYVGFPEDETYGLLKAIAKKKPGIIEPIRDRFINGFIEKTGSKENAEKVWKIIEDSVEYGFNSSHSLSVAYDSVYGAYLKAKHPLEYYTVILNIYEGDTEMTAKIVDELSYFNITISPIKFRLSKAHYTPDKESNKIYKGLASIKYLNEKMANDLYELGKNQYNDFIDLLVDIENNSICNSRQLEILIRLNFFDEFGSNGKLLTIYNKFKERYKKTHKDKTKQERLTEIREYSLQLQEEKIPVAEILQFEKDVLGYCQTTYSEVSDEYMILLDVDTKYTPKLNFYQLNNGQEHTYKISKKEFIKEGEQMLNVGDIVKIIKIIDKPKKKMINGKWQETGETEPWIGNLSIVRKYNKK